MPEPNFFIKKGDKSPQIARTLEDSTGAAVNITGATVAFKMKAIDGSGSVLGGAATIVAPLAGTVTYAWQTADTAAAGLYLAEWEVTFSGGSVETFPNGGYDLILVTPDLN